MTFNPTAFIDAYKISHFAQYPKGTQQITSNFTPRGSRIEGISEVVFFGLQYYILKYLMDDWKNHFFDRPSEEAVEEYSILIKHILGPGAPNADNIKALHSLGFMPIEIRALPEGSKVPLRVACYTIRNTIPEFYWVTNFLETQMSATIWPMCTSATIANTYRQVFNEYAEMTGSNKEFCRFQAHDFSARGMFGIEASLMSGAAHLLSSHGTDTIAAIPFLNKYYAGAETPFIGGSVAALEHAVVCANGHDEEATLRRLLTEVHPTGILSYVSDTWDFWNLIGTTLPNLKDLITSRNGKLVIRPDSGDPVKIMTGDESSTNPLSKKGLVQALWDIFGGNINAKGYKELHPSIGTIYGDSITLDRQSKILSILASKGFASSNVVLGIGSYTYQYVTRDTFGFAIKATHAVVNGEPVDLYKAPKTDDGTKHSAKGLIKVVKKGNTYQQIDQISEEEYNAPDNELKIIFQDGVLIRYRRLEDIRETLNF